MAEVGLVRFGAVALEVAAAVMEPYSSKFAKRRFTQPQLLAILCLMRFEEWTFREAEVRLNEHSELRRALGLERTPDYTTLHCFMKRLAAGALARVLEEAVRRMPPAKPGGMTVAVDATGLAPGAVSVFFVNRVRDRGNGLPWRRWAKWVVVVDVQRRMILAQTAKYGPTNDSATLRPLVGAAACAGEIEFVLADAEFDSELNHIYVRDQIGAAAVIPAKRGKKGWRKQGMRAEMERNFPAGLYALRNAVESVFSCVKRKLSSRAPGRSLATQMLQTLLLGAAYNIYRLRPRFHGVQLIYHFRLSYA